jgi:hypothetical protein
MRKLTVGVLIGGLVLASGAQAGPQPPQAIPRVTANPASPEPPQTFPSQIGLPGAANDRAVRARNNLAALLGGQIYTSDLSPQELQDVLDFQRAARGGVGDDRSFQQQCVDEEVRRNGGNPTRLAWEVIRMKCQ